MSDEMIEMLVDEITCVLNRLSARYRIMPSHKKILLLLMHGYSIQDISKILGVSKTYIMRHIHIMKMIAEGKF
jgi:transposase-like protein